MEAYGLDAWKARSFLGAVSIHIVHVTAFNGCSLPLPCKRIVLLASPLLPSPALTTSSTVQ